MHNPIILRWDTYLALDGPSGIRARRGIETSSRFEAERMNELHH